MDSSPRYAWNATKAHLTRPGPLQHRAPRGVITHSGRPPYLSPTHSARASLSRTGFHGASVKPGLAHGAELPPDGTIGEPKIVVSTTMRGERSAVNLPAMPESTTPGLRVSAAPAAHISQNEQEDWT
jgi:hypothetical protein